MPERERGREGGPERERVPERARVPERERGREGEYIKLYVCSIKHNGIVRHLAVSCHSLHEVDQKLHASITPHIHAHDVLPGRDRLHAHFPLHTAGS